MDDIIKQLSIFNTWDKANQVKSLKKEYICLDNNLKNFDNIFKNIVDLSDLLNLMLLENFDNELFCNIQKDLSILESEVCQFKLNHILFSEQDNTNCYMDIQSGSGGLDAQDWVRILLKMYLKWIESKKLDSEIISESAGEIYGLKSITIRITGQYAYGWLRTEAGIHRLVRKSPFDSSGRRHTSFSSVFVYPDISDNKIIVNFDLSDIRVDVYRASGSGGQHVNKTESAVRITHLPTNIVTQCQSSRSQHKNKEQAMRQLKLKLYNFELQKKQHQKQIMEKTKSNITWGSQIRSYILDTPRVKDIRTGIESRNVRSVLEGNLDEFVEASLQLKL